MQYFSESDPAEQPSFWAEYSLKRSNPVKEVQQPKVKKPETTEQRIERLTQENKHLSAQLAQSRAECNVNLKTIETLNKDVSFLASQLEILHKSGNAAQIIPIIPTPISVPVFDSHVSQKPEKPTKPTVSRERSFVNASGPDLGQSNRYTSYFEQRRREEQISSKLSEKTRLEQQIQQQQLVIQAREEQRREFLRNKYNAEDMSELDQLREIVKLQQKKINSQQEFIQELQTAPVLRRSKMQPQQDDKAESLVQIKMLQLKLIELQTRMDILVQAETQENDTSLEDGSITSSQRDIGVGQILKMQQLVQAGCLELRTCLQELSNKANSLRIKLQEAKAATTANQ